MIHRTLSRRRLLQAIGAATVGAPLSALAQGRCMLTFGSPACNTSDIPPVFAPTGWKTTSLEHFTFRVADYKKEAAFYIALVGWSLRSDHGKQGVIEAGRWGRMIFCQAPSESFESSGSGRGGVVHAAVESFCFGIEPWTATTVEAELKKRRLAPIAETGPNGFESFHVKDPDG